MLCIQVASEQFAEKKLDLRERKADLDAQARFLESEGINNKEVDAQIALFDREVVSDLQPSSPRAGTEEIVDRLLSGG